MPLMVRQASGYDEAAREWWLQLPLRVQSPNHAGGWQRQMRAESKLIDALIGSPKRGPGILNGFAYVIDRDRIDRISVVRISPRRIDAHDNLRAAFKPVIDAISCWLEEGLRAWMVPRSRVGTYDRLIEKAGRIEWPPTYEQATSETDPKAHGIQIRLRLEAGR